MESNVAPLADHRPPNGDAHDDEMLGCNSSFMRSSTALGMPLVDQHVAASDAIADACGALRGHAFDILDGIDLLREA